VDRVQLEKLQRDDWIVGGLALVLVFDLLVFGWFSLPSTATLTFRGATVAFGGGSLTATDTPDGWLGLLAVLSLLAVMVDLALERLSPETHVPVVGGSRAATRYALAVAATACLALKFLLHIGEFSNLGLGFWFGAILAGALVYLTAQARQGLPVVPGERQGPPAASGESRGAAGPPAA
jgi:hypothetical protein